MLTDSKFTTSLIADEPSVLSSDTWCTVPFSQTSKTVLGKPVDILLQLPTCLPLRNLMRKYAYSNPPKAGFLKRQLKITAKRLLSRLDDFWQQHKEDIDPDYDQRLQQTLCASTFTSEDWFAPHHVPCADPFPFQSAADAYLASMYDARRLTVLGFLASTLQEQAGIVIIETL